MNRRTQTSAIMCASAIVITSLGSPFVSDAYAEICVGSGPEICVDFLDAGDPDFPNDFTVNFSDPSNPDVTLIRGSLFWQVRSRVGPPPNDTPANIGDITLNPAVNTDDFGVKIANGAGPGAANVGTINLTDAGFTGFSSIEGGSISGNLSGGLTLVQDSGGNGGELTLTIDGDVSGPMTIPVLKDLTIGGDLTANIDVTDKMDGPGLVVLDNVTSGVDIHIADIASGDLHFTTAAFYTEFFAGDLILDNGIPFGTEVIIRGWTSHGVVIDLNGSDLAGTLWNGYFSAATITGGALTGTLKFGICAALLLQDCCEHHHFSSTVEFASVSSTGLILFDKCGVMDGPLSILGDMDGEITVEGYMTMHAGMTIDGIVRGDIRILEDVSAGGVISLLGRMEGGSLTVKGDVAYYSLVGSSQIIIADMVSDPGGNPSMVDLQQNLEGDLELYSGIKANQQVRVGRQVTSDGSILLYNNDVAGSLEIAWGGAGSINSGGSVSGTVILADGPVKTYSGSADFARVVGRGVIETVNGAHFSGTLVLASSSSGDVLIDGDCSGALSVGGTFKADVHIVGELTATGSLEITGMLGGRGRILVDGPCKGRIKVGERTDPLTLIDLPGGLYVGGKVEINTSEGTYNAEGDINVGLAAACSLSPPDVTFDGCIRIYKDSASVSYGNLEGAIVVSGCHELPEPPELNDLNICIDGNDNDNVTISQCGCPNQVGWSCNTCP